MTASNRFQNALLKNFSERPQDVFCHQVGETGERTLSWADLEAGCGAFGRAFDEAALNPGDQILIFLRHVPELYGSFFGAMFRGLSPAFMPCSSPRQDPGLYWRSHNLLLSHIQPAAIVTDKPTLAEMRDAGLALGGAAIILVEEIQPADLRPRPMPEDAIALLQHSSGTTGLKKGVALSYSAIVEQIENYESLFRFTSDDSIVSWLPLYHDMGLIACMVMPAYFAVPVTHIDPLYWVGRPGTLFDQIVAHRGTLTWLPNFAFDHLAGTISRRATDWDLSGMRAFINCSEPCKGASLDRFAGAFAAAGVREEQLQCCYAMAETVFAVAQTPLGGAPPMRIWADPASLDRGAHPLALPPGNGVEIVETGSIIDGLSVTIHDPNGEAIPNDLVGEIGIRGKFLFSGYNRDQERTAERMRGDIYLTRDLGFMHGGRLYVLGRLDDLLIINGRNLYAHEIEAALMAVPGLKPGRTVALSWFDPRIGSESLVVMAERDRGNLRVDDDLRREISKVLHSIFNIMPKAIELLEEGRLIKTTSGKMSRKENLISFLKTRV